MHVIDIVCVLFSLFHQFCLTSIHSPFAMDPTYPDHRLDESFSQTPRSRTNSGVSTTEGLLRSLQLADSPANTSLDPTYSCSRPASLRSRTSPALTSPDPTSSAFRPAVTSHTQSTFSLPLDEELDVNWFDNTQSTAQGTPLLRVDPAETYAQLTPSSSPPSNPQSATMRFVSLFAALGQAVLPLTLASAPSRSSTIQRSIWPGDHCSVGQVRIEKPTPPPFSASRL